MQHPSHGFAFLLVCLGLVPTPASAQEKPRWLFVPVTATELPASSAAEIDALSAAVEREGQTAWRREKAAAEFEERHSAEPASISADEVRTLQRLGESSLKSMAGADYETARRELDGAAALYSRAPEEFNRQAPKLVLDLCLFRARAMLETGNAPNKVKAEVRECRQRIPLEIEADLLKHTNPTVRQLLRDVSAEILTERTGTLEVQGPEGCQVSIDGVDSGRILRGRFVATTLIQGSHRVNLSCRDTRGRTHLVKVDESTQPVVIDVDFESQVRSRPFLFFRATGRAEDSLDDEATTLGETLGATTVVLMHRLESGAVQLRRVANGRLWTQATLPAASQVGDPWSDIDLTSAVQQLLLTPAAPVRATARVAQAPREVAQRQIPLEPIFRTETGRVRARRAGFTLLGLGAASVLVGTGLHLRARALRDRDAEAYNARLAEPDHAGWDERAYRVGFGSIMTVVPTMFGLGWGTSLLMATNIDAGRSNLALGLTTAVLGAGLVGVSAWLMFRADGTCDRCIDEENGTELSMLTLGAGVGLFSGALYAAAFHYLPVAIKNRRAERRTATVSIAGSTLSLRGTF